MIIIIKNSHEYLQHVHTKSRLPFLQINLPIKVHLLNKSPLFQFITHNLLLSKKLVGGFLRFPPPIELTT